jgi:hypothetical protein
VPITTPDDWNALIERCLAHRSDLLGKVLRQAIARPSRLDSRNVDSLLAAVRETSKDFTAQAENLTALVEPAHRERVRRSAHQFSTLGYALLDGDDELLDIANVRSVADHVSIAMHRFAYYGWTAFLPLNVPDRAPQIRTGSLAGRELTYLEGMRLEHTGFLGNALDYWRIYECAIGVSAESFRDGYSEGDEAGGRYLTPLSIFVTIHSVLAHARLLGQEITGVHRVVIRMEWNGLSGRRLMWDGRRVVSPAALVDDRFVKTVTLDWSELRDAYFSAFRRVVLPVLNLFPTSGWIEPDSWLTRELVEREFRKLVFDTMRLFDD